MIVFVIVVASMAFGTIGALLLLAGGRDDEKPNYLRALRDLP